MRDEGLVERGFPEVRAGGFTRVDGTVEFYSRVSSLLSERDIVVDFGAGRGAFVDDPVPFRRNLRTLKGRAGRIVGVDIDPAVLLNPTLDQGIHTSVGSRIPLPDESVDLIVSDHTFEHVVDVRWFTSEIDRILRPGGWICARTPNRWGSIAVPARVVPNKLHAAVLRRVQPDKAEYDTFPTAYRLNTKRALRGAFPESRFGHYSYYYETEPAYAGRSRTGWSVLRMVASTAPASLKSVLMVFIRKQDS